MCYAHRGCGPSNYIESLCSRFDCKIIFKVKNEQQHGIVMKVVQYSAIVALSGTGASVLNKKTFLVLG